MYKTELLKDVPLFEAYQTVGMRFAFAKIVRDGKNTKVQQLHSFVKCKDFLGDVMWASKLNKKYNLFKFIFDGTTTKIQFNTTAILIEFDNLKALQNNLRVIHHFEGKARWCKTVLIDLKIKVKNKPVYMAVGSPMWMRSPALLSLYTVLLRLAGVEIKKDEEVKEFMSRCSKLNTNDGRYIRDIVIAGKILGMKTNPFYTVMQRSRAIFKDTYKNGADAAFGTIHYQHGIKALFRNACTYQSKNKNFNLSKFASGWAKNLVCIVEKKDQK